MDSPPSQFSGDWITPTHSEYETSLERWSLSSQQRARVVAFVKTNEDIALALIYAKDNNLPVAIRGGGHSAAGASSIKDGLVIDLSRYFTHVTVDHVEKVARVGGGAVWKDVDSEAIKHELAAVGGTVNHTGVGGLTLGGGYGFLSGEHGLAIDNLLQVDIVTADGQSRTASETENPDLFWALRGGGCNFGVVTEFRFRLHPQRRTVFAGTLVFPFSANGKVTESVQEWWANGIRPQTVMLHCLAVGPDGIPSIVFILFCNGSEEEGRKHFKSFFDLRPVVDTCSQMPYEQVNAIQNLPRGHNYYMKGVFTSEPQDASSAEEVSSILTSLAPDVLQAVVMFEYIHTAKIMDVAPGVTAHVRGRRANTLILVSWEGGTAYGIKAAAADLAETIMRYEHQLPNATNTGYGNYIPSHSSEMAARMFGENYPRLQLLKKKFDPSQVFSQWCPIRPA